ncbi:MAG: ATP-binding protein [Solirubrobacteraceae bacterium]
MIDGVADALTQARYEDLAAIRAGIEQSGLTIVSGEAGVGKTTLLAYCAREIERQQMLVVSVNLDGAASVGHLAWLWLRALARALTPRIALSQIVALPQDMWPRAARSAALTLDNTLGPERSRIALADSPPESHGRKRDLLLVEDAIVLTRKLTETTGRPLLLILDHLEAPLLTPRHPLEIGALLWSVRSVSQTTTQLRVLLAGRPGLERELTGEQAAFYQDGRWVKLARPAPMVWQRVLASWSAEALRALLTLSELHVPTTLVLLHEFADERPSPAMIRQAFESLTATQAQHFVRCVEHARTLDRLGGEVLLAIAQRRGPYAGTGHQYPRDVQRAVNRLRLAGLIDRAPTSGWRPTDPLVAYHLCSGIDQTTWESLSAAEDDLTASEAPRGSRPRRSRRALPTGQPD